MAKETKKEDKNQRNRKQRTKNENNYNNSIVFTSVWFNKFRKKKKTQPTTTKKNALSETYTKIKFN